MICVHTTIWIITHINYPQAIYKDPHIFAKVNEQKTVRLDHEEAQTEAGPEGREVTEVPEDIQRCASFQERSLGYPQFLQGNWLDKSDKNLWSTTDKIFTDPSSLLTR